MRSCAKLRTTIVALLVAGLTALPAPSRAQDASPSDCGDSSTPYGVVQIDTYPRVDLELAQTPQQREVGLMYRESLPPDSGMLFVYQAPSTEGYWMYHTLIPLSIAWIDRDGTILDIQDMPVLNNPNDDQEAARNTYQPRAVPYWYALEVNEGWFVQHGVGIGQQFSFCLPGS